VEKDLEGIEIPSSLNKEEHRENGPSIQKRAHWVSFRDGAVATRPPTQARVVCLEGS